MTILAGAHTFQLDRGFSRYWTGSSACGLPREADSLPEQHVKLNSRPMACKLLCVAGARPNFMKLAPLLTALSADPCFQPVLVHTGQHYDDKMSGRFFRDLGIREPDHSMQVGSGSHAQQTAGIMKGFEPIVLVERPAAVVVVGDVNSTVACALVAAKLGVAVIHIEAGLRSFDRSMPEEINRIVTDSISSLLLASEESGRVNLLAEGHPAARIRVVGNLMIDTLLGNLGRARNSNAARELGTNGHAYGLVTLHRPANVDEPAQLRVLLEVLAQVAEAQPLYFPAHPRTRAIMTKHGLEARGRVHLIEPLGYLDFLGLMSQASVVLTDSGGIQEETTALGIPCLTLRDNTERPVTVEQGTNRIAGTTVESILAAWNTHRQSPKSGRVPPLWDGQTSRRCVEALRDHCAGGA
jgi:UDP-N-acetylglucosamine 2-epimerase (non-hydrolysing)